MTQKRILLADRLRRPPATGWSWVDRRFLREHGDYLSREALLLYFFFAAVADRHGLSFYSDHTLTSRLQLSPPALERARQELHRQGIGVQLGEWREVRRQPVPQAQSRGGELGHRCLQQTRGPVLSDE